MNLPRLASAIPAPDELQIRRAGDRALLVTPGARDRLAAVVGALRGCDLTEIEDFLPAAETVLVTIRAGADAGRLERELRALLTGTVSSPTGPAEAVEEVTIPVRYDGADLADVARLLGLSAEEVVAEHTSRVWQCRFIGFTAGFGYLESGPGLVVPRRGQSRTAVPSGAVALADGYSAVYPRRAPGGWQLIGTTEVAMWDVRRPRPALVTAGTRVRFVRTDR